jgi:hypothetical protein
MSNVPFQTIAETLLKASFEAIEKAATRSDVNGYHFADESFIEVRQMSGRSAYRRNGERIADSE